MQANELKVVFRILLPTSYSLTNLIHIQIGVRVFANGLRERGLIPVRVISKTQIMVLDASLLSIINYVSRVKWSNPGKGVAPSSIHRCSSYLKGKLGVTLEYDRLLEFTNIYIYIYILTNLLSTSIHGGKEKEKKRPEFRDNKFRIIAWGKKKKIIGEKKGKANFITPVEKNQDICNQLVKRPKTHRKMLQCYNYKKCSILNRANYNNYQNARYPEEPF